MIIEGLRQERRCLKRFFVFVRPHTRFGLGRLQTGDVVEERRGWRPPPLDPSPPPGKSGQAVDSERLWRDFFAEPSQWSDVRFQKINSKRPDFMHKRTKEALWMESRSTPSWVKLKLAAMTQGRTQPVESKEIGFIGPQSVDNDSQLSTATSRSMVKQVRTLPRGETGTSVSSTANYQRGSREGGHDRLIGSDEDIRKLCLNGRPKNVLHILEQRGIQPGSFAYVCLLRRCTNMKDLSEGKHVHAHIVENDFSSSTFLLNALLNMYVKCGSLVDARQVFDKMHNRDMFTWTIMLAGYAKLGNPKEAYQIYELMRQKGVILDRITFTTVLNVCATLRSLEKGRKVHSDIIKAGVSLDTILENTLVDMYGKCGSIRDGYEVFDNMAERTVVSWNVMIAGAAQNGYSEAAFDFFKEMQEGGMKPDTVTYVSVLNACPTLEQGKLLHSDIVKAGYELDIRVGTALVDMYAKCGSLEDALQVFNNLPQRNVVLWTCMIGAYAQHGEHEKALRLYEQLQNDNVVPDKLLYTTIFNVCASLQDLQKGRQVLDDMINHGIGSDIIIDNTLVDMYAKCGSVEEARQFFNNMVKRDVVSYTARIGGCVQHGHYEEAFEVFASMERENVEPNAITFRTLIEACAASGDLIRGNWLRARIVDAGLELDLSIRNALNDMYARCSSIVGNAPEVAGADVT